MTTTLHDLWPDVAGTFTLTRSDSHDFWSPASSIVLLLEQDGPHEAIPATGPPRARPIRRAGWVMVSAEALEDLTADPDRLVRFLAVELEHIFRPWAFPDPLWPALDLFPRFTRVRAWIRDTAHRLAEARSIERPTR